MELELLRQIASSLDTLVTFAIISFVMSLLVLVISFLGALLKR